MLAAMQHISFLKALFLLFNPGKRDYSFDLKYANLIPCDVEREIDRCRETKSSLIGVVCLGRGLVHQRQNNLRFCHAYWCRNGSFLECSGTLFSKTYNILVMHVFVYGHGDPPGCATAFHASRAVVRTHMPKYGDGDDSTFQHKGRPGNSL